MLVVTQRNRGPFTANVELAPSGPFTYGEHPGNHIQISFTDGSYYLEGDHAIEVYMTPLEAVHLVQALQELIDTVP